MHCTGIGRGVTLTLRSAAGHHDFDEMWWRAGDARATPKGRPQRIGGVGASRKRLLGDSGDPTNRPGPLGPIFSLR